jgi:hypothetical protein
LGCGHNCPSAVVPEEGQACERVEEPEGHEAGYLFHEEEVRSKYPHGCGDVGPQVTLVIGSRSLSGELAGVAGVTEVSVNGGAVGR